MRRIVLNRSIIPSMCLVLVAALAVGLMLMANKSAAATGIYIVDPLSSQTILPTTSPNSFPIVGATGGTTISVSACKGEFQPASIVITPTQNITGITVAVTNLTGPGGAVIPQSAVDVRVVKVWYRAGTTNLKGTKTLAPELLLKDDNLVKVDTVAQMNYLKVTLGNKQQYIDITTPTAIFPSSALVYDATTLQPFDVAANTNKQSLVDVPCSW